MQSTFNHTHKSYYHYFVLTPLPTSIQRLNTHPVYFADVRIRLARTIMNVFILGLKEGGPSLDTLKFKRPLFT